MSFCWDQARRGCVPLENDSTLHEKRSSLFPFLSLSPPPPSHSLVRSCVITENIVISSAGRVGCKIFHAQHLNPHACSFCLVDANFTYLFRVLCSDSSISGVLAAVVLTGQPFTRGNRPTCPSSGATAPLSQRRPLFNQISIISTRLASLAAPRPRTLSLAGHAPFPPSPYTPMRPLPRRCCNPCNVFVNF